MIAQLVCGVAALLLAVWGVQRAAGLVAAMRARPGSAGRGERARAARAAWPGAQPGTGVFCVTVQVPLFNEPDVCERAVDAACALRFPALEVQILDDSTDHTSALVAAAVARWRDRGVDVVHVQRQERSGFKAGALAAGLARARGDVIAIFDADFVPPADFLERAVPLLQEYPGADMVQARWDHLNRDQSMWTRAQAALLDAHFAVEQQGRSHRGRFFGFNGTAGVWRRSTIEQAGGWSAMTLTEDLDLSVRAWLQGARFAYLDALGAPAELPADVDAWRVQQHRWAKGALQTARLRLPMVWRSRLAVVDKIDVTLKLLQGLCWPLLAVVVLSLPFASLDRAFPSAHGTLVFWHAAAGLGALPALLAVVWAARKRGASLRAATADAVLALGLAAALSLHVARASLAGLFDVGDRTFHRTAKTGPSGVRSGAHGTGAPRALVLLEGGMGMLHLGAAALLTATGHVLATPFLWLCGLSLVALACRSVAHPRRGRLTTTVTDQSTQRGARPSSTAPTSGRASTRSRAPPTPRRADA